ncbi:hypothetical protein LZ198_10440 [Myxococcus sp. K15C18031901]|uniref:MYXO-CTERM-anchored inactivated metalloprotease n=1 Tax=Myxococcus dinghuensis TaxID=2906761 RepID=UPI0020A837D3|nr:MYXO-CTERM-anchored inactivated metalloprotease [Myxococcus dinghuensis]MCP3099289.1 hypothetical protein [Myxococcus dinghuensis]
MPLPRVTLLVPFVVLLAAFDAQAQAYTRLEINGTSLCQPQRTLQWSFTTIEDHPTAEERAATQAAFKAWQDSVASCSDITFVQGPDVPAGMPLPRDGTTRVSFPPKHCADVVPTNDACYENDTCPEKYACWNHGPFEFTEVISTFYTTTGAIVGSDIQLNPSSGRLSTGDGPRCPNPTRAEPGCMGFDVQALVTRSIGEVLGLALQQREDSTMYLQLSWGEPGRRVIDPGTLQGICDLYPRGQSTPGGCSVPTPVDENLNEDESGCAATGSAPLLAGLVLLLGAGYRRRREER